MIVLKIYIEDDSELKEIYLNTVAKHNEDLKKHYFDSGFDVYFPNEINIDKPSTFKVNFNLKCAMYDNNNSPMGFYLYPRSSISKTPWRLANNTGIIDSGYRGNICAYFDTMVYDIKTQNYTIEKHQRLLQICAPNLERFKIEIVNNKEELNSLEIPERGEKGFGSSGT